MKTLIASFMFAALCLGAEAQPAMKWSTLDHGGGSSTGGVYTVTGTAGQPDAGRWKMTGGEYTVHGGFWGRIAVVQMPGGPLLTIRRTGANTLAICWPYPSTGYGLQHCTNPGPMNWAAVTIAPVHVGDEWQVPMTMPTDLPIDPETGCPMNHCQHYRLTK